MIYKVVEVLDGYVSLGNRVLGEATVKYRLGEIARPTLPESRLFAFWGMRQALHHLNATQLKYLDREFACLECRGEQITSIPYGHKIPCPQKGTTVWSEGILPVSDGAREESWWIYVPKGTVLVDWLKPLRVVDGG